MGAQPIGAPGWPELAACTWSALRQRICTAHGGLAACVHSRPKVADKAGHKRGLPSKSPADFFRSSARREKVRTACVRVCACFRRRDGMYAPCSRIWCRGRPSASWLATSWRERGGWRGRRHVHGPGDKLAAAHSFARFGGVRLISVQGPGADTAIRSCSFVLLPRAPRLPHVLLLSLSLPQPNSHGHDCPHHAPLEPGRLHGRPRHEHGDPDQQRRARRAVRSRSLSPPAAPPPPRLQPIAS